MTVHELKTWPPQFAAVRKGEERFEYRRDDRASKVGDVLLFREWSPIPPPPYRYTDREMSVVVTYIARGHEFGIPDEFCVMSIEIER